MDEFERLREKHRQQLSGHQDPAVCEFINKMNKVSLGHGQHAVNLLLYLLLQHLAKKNKNGETDEVAEKAIKDILDSQNMKSIPSEVLTLEQQILMQQTGINPEGDDELSAFFKSSGISMAPEAESHETLEETAQKFSQRKTPTLKPPSPTDLP